jgi:hypothetical protein
MNPILTRLLIGSSLNIISMKRTIDCGLIATITLLVALMNVFSVSGTTVPTFTLSAQTSQLKYTLPAGTTFNGSITTSDTVRFWVSDPDGALIVNLGLVDNEAAFSFVAVQTGNYTLNFENTFPDPIEVSFSYQTNPELPGNDSTPLIYLAIPIAIAVFGSALMIVSIRQKRKKTIEKSKLKS